MNDAILAPAGTKNKIDVASRQFTHGFKLVVCGSVHIVSYLIAEGLQLFSDNII